MLLRKTLQHTCVKSRELHKKTKQNLPFIVSFNINEQNQTLQATNVVLSTYYFSHFSTDGSFFARASVVGGVRQLSAGGHHHVHGGHLAQRALPRRRVLPSGEPHPPRRRQSPTQHPSSVSGDFAFNVRLKTFAMNENFAGDSMHQGFSQLCHVQTAKFLRLAGAHSEVLLAQLIGIVGLPLAHVLRHGSFLEWTGEEFELSVAEGGRGRVSEESSFEWFCLDLGWYSNPFGRNVYTQTCMTNAQVHCIGNTLFQITTPEDDGKMLSCEARLRNSKQNPVTTQIEISVLCEYFV